MPTSITGWWVELHVPAAPALLTIAGAAPSVSVGRTYTPTGASLAVTGATPTVAVTQNQLITPTGVVLTIIGSVPALGVTLRPTAATLTVTGGTPTVTVAVSTIVTPDPAALTVAGGTPTVSTPVVVTPSGAALTVTGGSPVLDATLRPTAASLTVTGGTPAVTVSDNKTLQPTGAALTVTGGTPTVTATANKVVQPGGASLVVTGGTPSLVLTLRPSAASLTVTGSAPTVTVAAPPVSPVSSASAFATTATMPTHQAGDTLLVWAFRSASATAPTLPAGWTNVGTGSGTLCSGRIGTKVAASSSETTGTWTNATIVMVVVFRNVSALGASGLTGGGGSTTHTIPGLTLQVTTGSSWVVTFVGTNTGGAGYPATTTNGFTRRAVFAGSGAQDDAAAYDTNGGVTSWAADSATVGSSGNWTSGAVELKR